MQDCRPRTASPELPVPHMPFVVAIHYSVLPVSFVFDVWSGKNGCYVSHAAVQVEDALYFVPNPFPEDQLVGVTKQTLAIVDDTTREVPLSEV